MKLMTIVGIRPDFIRMSKIIRLIDDHEDDIEHILVHTNQHNKYKIDKIFFEELNIRQPDINLGIELDTQFGQISSMFLKLEKLIDKIDPDACLFLGDSSTSLGAIVASRLNKKVIHIEAGMRSFNLYMPEEKNRRIVDHISDLLYVYTERYKENLMYEGIDVDKIVVVGNPIVDVINECRPLAEKNDILKRMGLEKNEYFLTTIHRAENVDDAKVLEEIFMGLKMVTEKYHKPVIYPMYYRTQKRMEEAGLRLPKEIHIIEPLGFLEFLNLEINASCLITDSGTVQEEGCILNVPCVTVRCSTERPETVEVGANIIAGTEFNNILHAVDRMIGSKRDWDNTILGDGETCERIVSDIIDRKDWIENKDFNEFKNDDVKKRNCFSKFAKSKRG